MTTENVVILFTDVVGSTELSQRLRPSDSDEVRRGHFVILRRAVAENGGTEVKNLGDGVMAVFASASAALDCGVAMQQAVDRDNLVQEHTVGLRVGLSGGEVTREEDDYFGDPVVEAARLCSRCEGGQILAADVVRAMAGRRNRHGCRPLGGMALKGLPDLVETVEVLWEPLGGAGAVIPLPGRLLTGPAVGVVGRSSEFELITDAAKAVSGEGRRQVLLVSGEAGQGKSTLMATAARSAFDSGAQVLFGHSEEDLATPYQLFAEAIGHYVSHAPEAELIAHVESHGSELSRLVPALSSRIPDLPPSNATDSDSERFLLFAAVVGILATMSQHRPVVLVFDDLQWADKGSLLLLHHVAASDVPTRLLILGAYRDSELPHAHALVETLGALRRLDGINRIELSGLDEAGVMALMEAAAGHSLDDQVGLARAIFRETDGNPFFVSEVLRNLFESGSIRQDATGRWISEDSVGAMILPESVHDVIGARVVRLGKESERILSLAAVIGRDFDLDLLALAAGVSEDQLLDVLDSATAVALVREQAESPGQYSFAHTLIQRTLYEDLGPTRRTRAHRLVGEALEAMIGDAPGARIGELAHHWFSATQPVDMAKAIAYSQRAAEAAVSALAPDEAVRYFAQALQLLGHVQEPDKLLEVDLLIGLGNAKRQAGVPDFRETLLDAAHKAQGLGTTDRLVAAALANNRGLFSSLGVVDTEKVAVLEAVLDAMPAVDSTDRALLLATLCNEVMYGRPLEERQFLADQAKSMARRLADPATTVQVLSLVEQPLEAPPTLAERILDATEALSLAESLDDPVNLYFAALYRRISAMQAGDFGNSTRCLELMQSLNNKLRQPIFMWITKFHEASEALVVGDPERAELLTTEALQIGTDCGQPDAVSFYGSQMIVVRHQQGRLGEFLPVISSVASEMSGIPAFKGAVAVAHLSAGEEKQALVLLDGAAEDGFTTLPMDIGWLDGVTAYAEVAIELHREPPAERLVELLAPYHDQVGFNGLMPLEPVAHYLGGLASVLGRWEESEAYFIEATQFNNRAGAQFANARTDLSWGRMLGSRRAAGDASKARDLLTRAHATATAHGYGSVERHAFASLQELH